MRKDGIVFNFVTAEVRRYLHQDFDLDSGTPADAIQNALKNDISKIPALFAELDDLETRSDAKIREVLGDHEVHR